MTDVHFTGLRVPIRFVDCPSLLGQAKNFFHAWPFELCAASTENAVIEVSAYEQEKNGYDISAPWLSRALHEPTAASALCSLSVEIVAAFCEEHDMLCLHAAAAEIQGNTVLLLGDNHAGKSTLIVSLMADGCISYGDDLIGMTAQGQIFSFGIAPRLRLPLPPSETLHDFVRQNGGIGDERYLYVNADTPFSAPFGHTAKPTRIVLLQREKKGELAVLSQQDGLLEILSHYVMRKGTAEAVFRQAATLTADTPVLLFRYSSPDEAVSDLKKTLTASTTGTPSAVSGHDRRKRLRHRLSLSSRKRQRCREYYTQSADVRVFSEYGRLVLTDKNSDALFTLTPSGELLWNMMAQPMSEQEASLILQKAFPDINKSRIRHDVEELFKSLKQKKLITPCKETAL